MLPHAALLYSQVKWMYKPLTNTQTSRRSANPACLPDNELGDPGHVPGDDDHIIHPRRLGSVTTGSTALVRYGTVECREADRNR
jgi:hypothetical protein